MEKVQALKTIFLRKSTKFISALILMTLSLNLRYVEDKQRRRKTLKLGLFVFDYWEEVISMLLRAALPTPLSW